MLGDAATGKGGWIARRVRAIANEGLLGWLLFHSQRRAKWAQKLFGCRLWPRAAKFPLIFRPGSSDLDVYRQIFIEREYRCIDWLAAPPLILDCGANVGYSSAYFLTRYPDATVVAVEPDGGNFRILQANVALYGPRVRTVCAGVWSHPCGLIIERGDYRDGREWAVRVRESQQNESPDIQAVSIQSLLESSGFQRISLLKMDIERSEREVFRVGFQMWLPHCDAIVIELHDQECEEIFMRAIEGGPFEISKSGELTVCRRQ